MTNKKNLCFKGWIFLHRKLPLANQEIEQSEALPIGQQMEYCAESKVLKSPKWCSTFGVCLSNMKRDISLSL